jgi:hypothetical protein
VSKADRKRLAGLLLGLAKASLLVGPQSLQVEFDDFGFDDGGAARLGELRDVLLRQQGWGAKYSERYLTDALLPVIGALRTTPDYKQALTAAEKLDRDWQEFTDVQHVYLPVENIEMTLLELPIGRARIKRVTPAVRKQFEREIRGALARPSTPAGATSFSISRGASTWSRGPPSATRSPAERRFAGATHPPTG